MKKLFALLIIFLICIAFIGVPINQKDDGIHEVAELDSNVELDIFILQDYSVNIIDSIIGMNCIINSDQSYYVVANDDYNFRFS